MLRKFPFFTALFLAMPFIEIWLLIRVGSAIGAFPTFLLLVLAAVLGAQVLRQQGFATLTRIQQMVAAGQSPAREMMEGGVSLVGGILLMIPGFFTDILGLLCLFPPTRLLIIKLFLRRTSVQVQSESVYFSQSTSRPPPPSHGGHDIEGEVLSRKDDGPPRR